MHSRIWSFFFIETEGAASDFFLLVSLVECFIPSSDLSKHGKTLLDTEEHLLKSCRKTQSAELLAVWVQVEGLRKIKAC